MALNKLQMALRVIQMYLWWSIDEYSQLYKNFGRYFRAIFPATALNSHYDPLESVGHYFQLHKRKAFWVGMPEITFLFLAHPATPIKLLQSKQ